MRPPIYKPKGAAAEYAPWALNIYTGCTNGCAYCYAPGVLRKTPEAFAEGVRPRDGLIDALEKQLASGKFEGETVHLCFTCDPFPSCTDVSTTRQVIRMLKDAGAHVQVLTKNPTLAGWNEDLYDKWDMIGTTITGAGEDIEPFSEPEELRLGAIQAAKKLGFGTWVSCEPVYDPEVIFDLIREGDYIDMFKIGKLNHRKSDIDWAAFGHEAERLCIEYGRNYVIKDSLRKEMAKCIV